MKEFNLTKSELKQLNKIINDKDPEGRKKEAKKIFEYTYKENPNFNRTALAKLIGVSRKTIQKWLNKAILIELT